MSALIFNICILFFNLLLIVVHSDPSQACPTILKREDWGGDKPVAIDYRGCPLDSVVIHHTVTNTCHTREECSKLVRSIQSFHMDELDFDDIGYNFLIGSDGYVYEGPGFHRIGAHTRGYNTRSIGLAFIGTFSEKYPDEKQLRTAKKFLECALESGELHPNYALFGAKQVSSTLSPGRRLYRKIKTWPNFVVDPKSRPVNCVTHIQ